MCVCVCVCVCMRTFKFYSLSKFQIYNTVLPIIVMIYIRSSDLIHLITESMYSYQPLPISPIRPPLATTL